MWRHTMYSNYMPALQAPWSQISTKQKISGTTKWKAVSWIITFDLYLVSNNFTPTKFSYDTLASLYIVVSEATLVYN